MTDSIVASQAAPAGNFDIDDAAAFGPDPQGAAAPTNGDANGAHREDLVVQVHRLLTDHLNIDAPSADSDIVDSGALDSFTMVELLATVEEQFGVEVPIETLDVDNFRSARSVADLIATQQGG